MCGDAPLRLPAWHTAHTSARTPHAAAPQANPNSNAVLLTTEIVTPCFYAGRDRHRMVRHPEERASAHRERRHTR